MKNVIQFEHKKECQLVSIVSRVSKIMRVIAIDMALLMETKDMELLFNKDRVKLALCEVVDIFPKLQGHKYIYINSLRGLREQIDLLKEEL